MPSGSSTARHPEVERKFDVDDATVPPSFAGIAGVARVAELPSQSLDAVYFDTPAHDLATSRITLRRRTGGTDAGWHLKLPAGPDTRTEVREPLGTGDDEVPSELSDLVLAIVRDRPLAPVARITTDRSVALLHGDDGSALAEFCDDRVTARTVGTPVPTEQRWREWELELIGADAELLDRLSDRLIDTGATPAGHASKLARALGTAPPTRGYPDPVHRALAEQVDNLLVWDRAVREDADDAVHQMRVAIRKIRSLLQAGRLSDSAAIIDELRWLAGLLGVARDAEVLAKRYRRALHQLPAELVRGRVTQRLVHTAQRRYRAGRRHSLIAMRSARYFRLLDGLDALVAEPATGSQATSQTLDAAYRQLCKRAKAAAGAAAGTGRDQALHRIRKAAKRLRYTAAATDAAQ
ncbi:MAG TPA: CYTH and CHAD domain-containing protein, partial [Mycobacterium sp.]|nr:CYTH and CHAD domain-containing protein [Mycobacterium sp.]